MKANFEASMEHLMKSEGGFSNHPLDPGGMTNLGVTQKIWEAWVGHPVTEQEMRALTPMLIGPMYKAKYWDKIAGDTLPSGLDYTVFDAAVNSGPGQAAKWLQRIVDVAADGSIGPKTLIAIAQMDTKGIVKAFRDYRMSFLRDLPSYGTFGTGWSRRVVEVTDTAEQMIG
jgi:lysozyme family protein